MTTKSIFTIFFGLSIIYSPLHSQVTIGNNKEPEKFSVLELISNNSQGLRLPQLETAKRNEISDTYGSMEEMMGLTIYNTTTHCVNVWNGTKWIDWCAPTTDPRDIYPQDKSGNYILSGKVCYDVYVTDWNYAENNNCLPLASRVDAFANGYSFTYKFTGSATFSNLTFEVIDPNGLVASKNLSGNDLTLTFSNDVKIKAKGTTKDNPLKVFVVAVFKDNTGNIKQIALEISVQDCTCGCAIKVGTNTWLTFMCYNLGVPESTKSLSPLEQSNTFSTAVVADLPNDSTIYGALYQWGRKTDGHQMRNSQTYPNPLQASVAGNLDANGQVLLPAAYGKFVLSVATVGIDVDWRNPSDLTLWNSGTETNPVKTINDPCPTGWRVPTYAEWTAVYNAKGTYYTTTWLDAAAGKTSGMLFTPVGSSQPTLFLPGGGYRNGNSGAIIYNNPYGHYWSSYTYVSGSNYAYTFQVGKNATITYPNFAGGMLVIGRSVRCIAE